ncbi:MAG: single-stranded DNA-binding protein [Flavobacteriaceae bacterium]|nr:MAG: single-stranded DNA-binding protein [Flavobacteriaceae bacterium]
MNGTINKVILLGNLGDDIKIHRFESNQLLARFPLATSESYTDKATQEKIQKTEWHTIVAKGKLAEVCQGNLHKGDKIYLEGKIKNRKWDDESGQTKYITEIYADKIEFISLKNP